MSHLILYTEVDDFSLEFELLKTPLGAHTAVALDEFFDRLDGQGTVYGRPIATCAACPVLSFCDLTVKSWPSVTIPGRAAPES